MGKKDKRRATETGRSFLTDDEKNAISHRGSALEKMKVLLREYIN